VPLASTRTGGYASDTRCDVSFVAATSGECSGKHDASDNYEHDHVERSHTSSFAIRGAANACRIGWVFDGRYSTRAMTTGVAGQACMVIAVTCRPAAAVTWSRCSQTGAEYPVGALSAHEPPTAAPERGRPSATASSDTPRASRHDRTRSEG
jgi:hypothetical protein